MAVSTVTAETMRATGAIDLQEISTYIPNFEFSDASILPNLYIRGIGSGTTHSIEQSVGRFIDDVYIGRAVINLHPLMDIASVEVLRGPQGTLFGKNTLAGALIINTGEPSDTLEAGVFVDGSAYSTVGNNIGAEAFVAGPLTDTLSARVALLYRDRDGYIRNDAPGPDGGTREDFGSRLKLRWQAGDFTTVDFKAEYYTYTEEGQTPSEVVGAGPPIQAFQAFNPSFTFERDWVSHYDCEAEIEGTTFCPERDQDTFNLTLDVAHEFDGLGELRSITAFQRYDYLHRFIAVDGGVAGGAFRATRDEEYEGLTQEFRFTSEEYEKFDYIVGLYGEISSVERLQRDDTNVPAFLGGGPPANTLSEDWLQDTTTVAIFGQARYRFNDQWSAIVGGRFSWEEKDFTFLTDEVGYNEDPRINQIATTDTSRTENRFTPSVTLRYEPSSDLMLFATFAQGHKTGGFSDRPQEDPTFQPEVNNSFELGMKGTFFDGLMQLNATAFHMRINDLQVARALPGPTVTFEVANAAKAISQGIELESTFFISDQWTAGANLAYTDATYDDFPGALETCPAVGGRIEGGLCNLAGVPLIFAPEWKAGAFLQFNSGPLIKDWELSSRLDFNYSSKYYTELSYFENLAQEEFVLVNLNATVTSPDGRVAFTIFGKNLTEQHVLAWGLEAGPSQFVTPNAPREIGARFTFRY
ncbi:MAG: TonB-dependent receptor [Pseudomonadota bacterium]